MATPARILITGTSSGIGLATALELGRAGHKVYATMRNPARAPQLGEQVSSEGLPVSILTMDVDSDQSVADCFAGIHGRGEQIDVLVNNAGIERHGSVEELPMEDFRATMETNYFGALRCIRQVVPRMRERGSGCIINVSSVAGKIACSPLTPYMASKFALEALSEALAGEMKPFGVRVVIVQPGIIETAMPQAITEAPPSLYRQVRQLGALFRASLEQPTPPSVVAVAIRNIIESGTWKLRHPVGPDAEPFLSWRAGMTDEQWVDFNALDADGFRKRVKADFGFDLDLSSDPTSATRLEACGARTHSSRAASRLLATLGLAALNKPGLDPFERTSLFASPRPGDQQILEVFPQLSMYLQIDLNGDLAALLIDDRVNSAHGFMVL